MAVVPSVPVPDGLLPADNGPMSEKKLKEALRSRETTASQLFAILRQEDKILEKYLGNIIHTLLENLGVDVNDRDGISDMSMLHFASRFTTGAQIVEQLIKRGGDVNGMTKWTKMTPLHYAAFFNASKTIPVLAKRNADINAACTELEGGTPLHLAAMAGAVEAVGVLLENGADPSLGDTLSRTALALVQQMSKSADDPIDADVRETIIQQLSTASRGGSGRVTSATQRSAPAATPVAGAAAASNFRAPARPSSVEAYAAIDVGMRVRISKSYQEGLVRFRGPVQFDKKSDWVGIQLDSAGGKNNGNVGGVEYFRCKPRHGIFVRAKFLEVIAAGRGLAAGTPVKRTSTTSRTSTPAKSKALGATSRPGSARKSSIRRETPQKGGFGIGTKVRVTKQGATGTVRYIGPLDVAGASGTFLGVEFRDPVGTNDGSVEGKSYFKVKPLYGLFTKPDRCTWRGMKVTEDMLP